MTPSDSPEFLAILERVPRWHMLTPEADEWREGDEFFDIVDLKFDSIAPVQFRQRVNGITARRPIPEHVRRSEAWWALYNQLAKAKYGARECAGNDLGWIYSIVDGRIGIVPASACFGIMKFESRDAARAAIPILGGESEIIKNFQEGPGAYMWWVLNV